jgi:hypothetical protein
VIRGLLNDVAHGVAAVVEFGGGAFLCAYGVEGEKEEAALGAEGFFTACRVPAFVKAFGVKDNKTAASFEDFVSASFFTGAHKGGDASASWSKAARLFNGFAPEGVGGLPLSRALKSFDDGET